MALYQVCPSWEHNMHDDSDFYIVAYDSEANKLERIEVGSTRYAAGRGYTGITQLAQVPEEIMVKAESALAELLFNRITHAEERRIMSPKSQQVSVGASVILTAEVKNRPRETVEETCFKCDGTGHWVNPRNSNDKRNCFACSGSGKKGRSKAGKGSMVKFPVGTIGTVKAVFENWSKYGTWEYAATIVVETELGECRAKITNVRLNEELPTPEKVREAANKIAAYRDFYSQFATSCLSMV